MQLADIRRWSKSDNVDILGFTSALIHDARFRINPPLTPDEYRAFVMHYYERCLKEDPKSKWAESRYSAGTTLVNVFASLWRDSSVPREVVREFKIWLGRLYAEGDGSVRTCIVTATLEHLFEQKDIRELFSDWKKDPVLAIAAQGSLCVVLGWWENSSGKAASKAPSQIIVAKSR